MAIKIAKRAEAQLGKLGGVPIVLTHENGVTAFQLGAALVPVADIRRFIADANEVLSAIGEQTL